MIYQLKTECRFTHQKHGFGKVPSCRETVDGPSIPCLGQQKAPPAFASEALRSSTWLGWRWYQEPAWLDNSFNALRSLLRWRFSAFCFASPFSLALGSVGIGLRGRRASAMAAL